MSNKPKIYDITATGTTTPRDIRDRFSDVINVKDFGAVGDGITDDTEAFEKAAATQKKIFIPKGSYLINEIISGDFYSLDTINFINKKIFVNSLINFKNDIELYSNGKRTVRFNKDGVPSIFYRLQMFYLDDIISSWPHEPHPAFIVNDGPNGEERILKEILIGCYEASLFNDRYAVSLPNRLPHTYQPFDIFLAYSRANNVSGGINVEYSRRNCNNYSITLNGELDTNSHFHMMTNAEYSALALWCWKMGYEPRGNSWYGENGFYKEEKGILPNKRFNYDAGVEENPYNGLIGSNCPTMTGSSPNEWTHDGTPTGIENIVGNAACWVTGLRIYNGQLQSFVNNNAALPDADFGGRNPVSPLAVSNDVTEQRYYNETWKGYKCFDIAGNFRNPSSYTGLTIHIDGSYLNTGEKTPTSTYTYGNGNMNFSTKIDVPDSGGTTNTKWSYNEETKTFYLDNENGIKNGSAFNWFNALKILPDNPEGNSNFNREQQVQLNVIPRALGLYPICSTSDLYRSNTYAAAAKGFKTNPETGKLEEIKNNNYYFDRGYAWKDGVLDKEILNAYNTQIGRCWSRVPGDRPAMRGGTYYYDDPVRDNDPSHPFCSLWTTTYANLRYAPKNPLNEMEEIFRDVGVGWMSGYRICYYD